MKLQMEKIPRSVRLRREAEVTTLHLLDQRKLPDAVEYLRLTQWPGVVDAIKTLAVRGAPAIGVAGAAAVALWAADENSHPSELTQVCQSIADARPTAVNLSWAVDKARMAAEEAFSQGASRGEVAGFLFDLVKDMEAQDEQSNRAIGAYGAALLNEGSRVLTHCNAGSLATVFFGTALGVIYAAAEQGKIKRVYADETRPVGQGSRLTSWELAQAGVPVTLICDNMAASLMAQGAIDAVIVGADRIAANGDTANKIGTYGVAVLAKHHGVPFYIAAPASTIDISLPDGSFIPIEQRNASEVLPSPIEGVEVWNPAFDVTPAELIAGIITDRGVFKPEEIADSF